MLRFIQSRIFMQTIAVLAVLSWAVYMMVSSSTFVQVAYPSFFWKGMISIQSHYVAMCLVLAAGFLIQLLLSDVYYFRGGFGDTHHLMVVFWLLLL